MKIEGLLSAFKTKSINQQQQQQALKPQKLNSILAMQGQKIAMAIVLRKSGAIKQEVNPRELKMDE